MKYVLLAVFAIIAVANALRMIAPKYRKCVPSHSSQTCANLQCLEGTVCVMRGCKPNCIPLKDHPEGSSCPDACVWPCSSCTADELCIKDRSGCSCFDSCSPRNIS